MYVKRDVREVFGTAWVRYLIPDGPNADQLPLTIADEVTQIYRIFWDK